MKIICFSDSHGTEYYMRQALTLHPDAEIVFFLGDGLRDIAHCVMNDRKRMWLPVRGNCDIMTRVGGKEAPKLDSITLFDKKIIFTHGDLYGVKYGTDGIISLAEGQNADIVLFGHTHRPFERYIPNDKGGVYLFNPGSIGECYPSSPSFGVITLDENNVLFSHGSFT